jgi:protein TonB
MATDGSAKNNLPLLVGGAAAAMVALVVGATLFMGHVASPQEGTTQTSAAGGNFFNFSSTVAQKPHRAPAQAASPPPTPAPLATATPVATPSPATETLVALRKKRALALLHENAVQATPSAVALANGVTHSDVSGVPAGLRPLRAKPAVVVTEAPLDSQPTVASTPAAAPVATAAQVASAPQQAGSVYAPGTILDARFIARQEPVYPEIAREQDARGTAIVLVTIGPKGNVLSARVSQSTGFQMLDNAALDAAHSSSFLPPVIDGKPATATYRITYDFAP